MLPAMKFRMGVEIGGTFADGVVIDDSGTIHPWKELFTPKKTAELRALLRAR
jgi:N-methylhydantoinase A/oxoprolinase/acetone carboxylase beta subunit